MPPNVSRLLLRWGASPVLKGKVVEPNAISIRRWKDGNLIGYTKLDHHFRNRFRAPYYVVHRAHLHESMQTLARELGVRIVTASKVTDIDVDGPSLSLQSGATFEGDLIVAADGKGSKSERRKAKSL